MPGVDKKPLALMLTHVRNWSLCFTNAACETVAQVGDAAIVEACYDEFLAMERWRSATVAYEANMTILFDVVTKSIVVGFRDELVTLPGPFLDRKTAIAAGEAYCKSLGWNDAPRST
jgi:hypothetical protein